MTELKARCLTLIFATCSALASAQSIFDGEGLAGWRSVGDAVWVVDNKEIAAHGSGDGYLASDSHYDDFELSVEFWVDGTTNSGVFVRCQDPENIHPETCYELNIWDDHPRQEARTGAIVFKVMPPLAQVDTVGRWNTLIVVAAGASLTVTMNGQKTAELTDAAFAKGFIALQHFAEGTIRFRNLQVKVLDGDPS